MKYSILCILCILCPGPLHGGDNLFIPHGARALAGYVKADSGEQIGYHSFHPEATRALLTRSIDSRMGISWETAPMPLENTGGFVYFVWIAAYSSGTSAGDRTFDCFVNGKRSLMFRTFAHKPQMSWSVDGEDGSQLSFRGIWRDQLDDVYGYCCLKIRADRYPPGRPLSIAVCGRSDGARDWYMTFMYTLGRRISAECQPALVRVGTDTCQLVQVTIDNDRDTGLVTLIAGKRESEYPLRFGLNRIDFPIDRVAAPARTPFLIREGDEILRRDTLAQQPVPFREFWFLPHSHNDIGYSDLQADVAKKQVANVRKALELIQKTTSYPTESRFRWNVEILWGAEQFLAVASDSERRAFGAAVRDGSIGLGALYANQLTGICRPEELYRLTDYARELADRFGAPIDAAMISDIPGFTWSFVPALAQGGVHYLTSGPNFVPSMPDGGDRVGTSTTEWGDRPFYWKSPSGADSILFWMAGHGYSWFHGWIIGKAGAETGGHLFRYLKELDRKGYPYDMIQVRYTVYADNGPADEDLPDFVRQWNDTHVSPKIVIAAASSMFHEFERRYRSVLPVHSGDLTPYWEDGALSTTRETALAKKAAEKLLQAEVLSAMGGPPAGGDRARFREAWRNVHLYDEHTWGAYNSVSEPDSPFAVSQWNVKASFARAADSLSDAILNSLLSSGRGSQPAGSIEIVNTESWTRSGLVTLPAGVSRGKDVLLDDRGRPVVTQRLSTGELAFVAEGVPPLGAKFYSLRTGKPAKGVLLRAAPWFISNGQITAEFDTLSGGIRSITRHGDKRNLIDPASSGLNAYWYVPGTDPAMAKPAGKPAVSVTERGPVCAVVRMTSEAPGTRSLVREYRLVRGSDRLDVRNVIDKLPVRAPEAVHIGYPFSVPGGTMRVDDGWGIIRPDRDRLAGSCNDYLSGQRWVDVSDDSAGVTCATDFLSMVEPDSMTVETALNGGVRRWRQSTSGSSRFYYYLMNNYWHTNYKADQEGETEVRYAVMPHGRFDPALACRLGMEINHPLLVRTASEGAIRSPFRLEARAVVVTSARWCDDGKGLLLRLYNPSPEPDTVTLRRGDLKPLAVRASDENGVRGASVSMPMRIEAFGIVTLRYEPSTR